MPETFLLLFLLLMLFRSFARFSRSVATHTEHEHVRGSNSLCTPFFSSLHLPPSLTTQHDTHFLLVFLSFIIPSFSSFFFLHSSVFLSSTSSAFFLSRYHFTYIYHLFRSQPYNTLRHHFTSQHFTTLHHFDNLSIEAASRFPSSSSLTETSKTRAQQRRLYTCVGSLV